MLVALLIGAIIAIIGLARMAKSYKKAVEAESEYRERIEAQLELRRFSLFALDNMGRALGGLTPENVRIAFAVADACGQNNTVAEDLEDALSSQMSATDDAVKKLEAAKFGLKQAENDLEQSRAALKILRETEALLPPD